MGTMVLDEGRSSSDWQRRAGETRAKQALSSLLRVGLPTIAATFLGFFNFDNISLYIRSYFDASTMRILMLDDAQFVQNFLTVADLLLAILAGNIYDALYRQQEAVYFALFREVSEAKALLEQLSLLGQTRPFYPQALRCMQRYVKQDLCRLEVTGGQAASAAARGDSTAACKADPFNCVDPLEEILLLTSVGVPSVLSESLDDLRKARSERLGALQVKFPALGIAFLYLLATFELIAFPLIGAGSLSEYGPIEGLLPSSSIDNVENVLSVQAFLFSCLCGCFVLVLRIIQELRQSSGGVFNVDGVLQQTIAGLDEEIELRLAWRAMGIFVEGPGSLPLPRPQRWGDSATGPERAGGDL